MLTKDLNMVTEAIARCDQKFGTSVLSGIDPNKGWLYSAIEEMERGSEKDRVVSEQIAACLSGEKFHFGMVFGPMKAANGLKTKASETDSSSSARAADAPDVRRVVERDPVSVPSEPSRSSFIPPTQRSTPPESMVDRPTSTPQQSSVPTGQQPTMSTGIPQRPNFEPRPDRPVEATRRDEPRQQRPPVAEKPVEKKVKGKNQRKLVLPKLNGRLVKILAITVVILIILAVVGVFVMNMLQQNENSVKPVVVASAQPTVAPMVSSYTQADVLSAMYLADPAMASQLQIRSASVSGCQQGAGFEVSGLEIICLMGMRMSDQELSTLGSAVFVGQYGSFSCEGNSSEVLDMATAIPGSVVVCMQPLFSTWPQLDLMPTATQMPTPMSQQVIQATPVPLGASSQSQPPAVGPSGNQISTPNQLISYMLVDVISLLADFRLFVTAILIPLALMVLLGLERGSKSEISDWFIVLGALLIVGLGLRYPTGLYFKLGLMGIAAVAMIIVSWRGKRDFSSLSVGLFLMASVSYIIWGQYDTDGSMISLILMGLGVVGQTAVVLFENKRMAHVWDTLRALFTFIVIWLVAWFLVALLGTLTKDRVISNYSLQIAALVAIVIGLILMRRLPKLMAAGIRGLAKRLAKKGESDRRRKTIEFSAKLVDPATAAKLDSVMYTLMMIGLLLAMVFTFLV